MASAEATLRLLTQDRPYLTARLVQLSRGLTLDEVEQLFEQACGSHSGSAGGTDAAPTCTVDYVAWRRAGRDEVATSMCSASVMLCGSRQEADKLCREREGFARAVYALRVGQAASSASLLDEMAAGNAAGAPPRTLAPAVAITMRPHPLVSRASLEVEVSGSLDEVCAPPATAAPCSTTRAERSCTALAPHTEPPPASAAATTSADAALAAREASEEPSRKVDAVVCSAAVTSGTENAAHAAGRDETGGGATTETAAGRPASVFDLMCGAAKQATAVSATPRRMKRTRSEATAGGGENGGATREAKATRNRKPKLEAAATAATTTKSLTKLARASAKARAKKAGVEAHHTSGGTGNVLDDETNDGDTVNSATNSTSVDQASTYDVHCEDADASVSSAIAAGPAFDVQVTAVNDEIIMCDDAPPLVFCAPTAAGTATLTAQGPAAARNHDGDASSQSTLSAFFSPAVTAFQRGFKRELDTETALVDGEYVCRDVVRYRVAASGELVDEAEYHRRTADFIRQHKEQEAMAEEQRVAMAKPLVPTLSAAETNKENATRSAGKGAGRLRVARQVNTATKTEAANGMTLLSFMRRT